MTFFTKTIKTLVLLLAFAQVSVAQIYSEDFQLGVPADWTVGDVWMWGDATTASSQYFAIPDNGNFMYINDDALGDGAPAVNELAYSGAIDLTGESGPLFLQANIYFEDGDYGADETIKIFVSDDSGATWTELLNVPGDETAWQNTIVDISAYAGAEIHVGFEYVDGNVWNYGAAFNNVSIVNENPALAVDLRANGNWFSMPATCISPLEQAEVFYPMSDFQNVGSEDQPGVVLNISLEDEANATVFTDDIEFGLLQVDSLAENQFFNTFTPDATGFYRGSYSISGDNADADPSNNFTNVNFMVSDTVFANEFILEVANGQTLDVNMGASTFINPAIFPADVPRQWSTGNVFHVNNGADKYMRYVTVAMSAPVAAAGQNITFSLYKWTDANADNNPQFDELITAGVSAYVIQGGEDGLYSLLFEDIISGAPVAMEDNTTYILNMEYLNSSTDAATDISVDIAVFDDLYFYGTWFAHAENGELDVNSTINYAEDNTGIIGKDLSTFSTAGLKFSPLLRMSIGDAVIPDNTTQLSIDNSTKVFPLPASETVNLELNFVETVESAVITIMDDAGKQISTMQLNEVKNQTLEFNTSDLANGVYFFNIQTELGTRAELFIVQH